MLGYLFFLVVADESVDYHVINNLERKTYAQTT